MVLARSDSGLSAWHVPTGDDVADHALEGDAGLQRRIGHLTAVLIRNLTLNPRRDEISSLLHAAPAHGVDETSTSGTTGAGISRARGLSGSRRLQFAADDTDLVYKSRRKRSSSAVFPTGSAVNIGESSDLGGLSGHKRSGIPVEWSRSEERMLGLPNGSDVFPEVELSSVSSKPSNSVPSTRQRSRASSTAASNPVLLEEEEENAKAETEADDGDEAFAQSLSFNEPELPINVDGNSLGGSPTLSRTLAAARNRNRSTSRASLASSINTIRSNSTIRQTPHLPPQSSVIGLSQRHPTSYSSESQIAKEKSSRERILSRRLVDSFISLHVVPLPPSDSKRSAAEPKTEGNPMRKRGYSYSTRNKLKRSASSSSAVSLSTIVNDVDSALKRPSFLPAGISSIPSGSADGRRTIDSSPLALSAASSEPFFVSAPATSMMHPIFFVDREDFLLPTEDTLYEARERNSWAGLREGRLVVKVWFRKSSDRTVKENGRVKGKNREIRVDADDWKLLTEWDVDLSGLVSIGHDPLALPRLPPNSLVFAFHDEYFTAPVPSRIRTHSFGQPYSEEGESDMSDVSNHSDPGGTVVLSRHRARKAAVREAEAVRELDRRRRVVEKSVRETRMVRVAAPEKVISLLTIQKTIEEARAEAIGVKKRMNVTLMQEDDYFMLEREKNEIKDRLHDLATVKEELRLDIEDDLYDLNQRNKALDSRRERLRLARQLEKDLNLEADTVGCDLRDGKERLQTANLVARKTRFRLITTLSQIFPIEPSSQPSTALLFTILSLPLPNSSYPDSFSDEQISSALGYTAQVVATLAGYLAVPLHYPIKCLGSRSAVLDVISMMKGPRAFPLYGKGVDKYRFDYGVFLLNKNIEQLMYLQGLTVLDLRNTLPNLKSLILSLSLDSSHPDFIEANLHVAPSFLGVEDRNETGLTSTTSPTRFDTAHDSFDETESPVLVDHHEDERGELTAVASQMEVAEQSKSVAERNGEASSPTPITNGNRKHKVFEKTSKTLGDTTIGDQLEAVETERFKRPEKVDQRHDQKQLASLRFASDWLGGAVT